MNNAHIIIFAKAPLAGIAKTRLIPKLGKKKTALLAKKMLRYTLQEATAVNVASVELCVSPNRVHPIWDEVSIPDNVTLTEQGEGNLGEKMARAAKRALQDGLPVLLMGTDCPELNSNAIKMAAKSLDSHDACIVPVKDGGYALLGLKTFSEAYFFDIPWSTNKVTQITKDRLAALNKNTALLPALHDIDEAEDLQWLPQSWLNELS